MIRVPYSAAALIAALLIPAVHAAEKIDLDRLTPVAAGEQIPVSDFFRPALFASPQINPSGSHIAALISSGEDKYQLLTVELDTMTVETLGGMADKDISSVFWINDRRLMFRVSRQKLYGLGIFAAELGRLNAAYPLLQYVGASLVAIPRQNREKLLFWARSDMEGGKDMGVVVVDSNIRSGTMIDLNVATIRGDEVALARDQNDRKILETYPVPKGELGVGYWPDRDGNLAYAYTSKDGLFSVHRWSGKDWKRCPIDLELNDLWDVADEPGKLVVSAPKNPGKPNVLCLIDAETGELGDALIEDPGYDFTGYLYRDPASRAIVGAVHHRNGPTVTWFNEGYRALQKVLNGMFPGLFVQLLGGSENGKVFLVGTYSDKQPMIYHYVNLEKKTGGLIKNSRPWIDAKRMQGMIPIKYKTRDGLSLDAYLTLPAGASKKNPPPLVVLPHGGPWVRDTWGFDGEVQFLASRGYAVLQPNYRGSTGYDWMYPEEDRWAFRKMHDDVTDCVKLVINSGRVDGNRVAIMGASFGGYLSVSGVAFEPELYRCAVTIAGVFDWAATLKSSKYSQHQDPEYARLLRKLGDPGKQADKFDAISPIRHVKNVKVPVFVSHGVEDPVVEITESKRLVSQLQKHGIPHETYFVGEAGHGMGKVKDRVELYQKVEAFLAKHLSPAPVAVTSN